jgi:hypothetical protein
MAKDIRVVIGYDDFQTLVSGGVLKRDGVEIILSDIGHFNMIDLIRMEIQKP